MKSLNELFQQKKYDAVLEATGNSESASDLFLRLQCFDALELYEEWLKETQRSLFKLLPMMEWIIEKHIFYLRHQKITRMASNPLKTMYEDLPYINQSVEELLSEFKTALLEDASPTPQPPMMPSNIVSWLKEKKYGVLFDRLAEENAIALPITEEIINQLKQPLPYMVQTFLLLYLQRVKCNALITFERAGLVFEVVPKDLSPLHEHPFVMTTIKEFAKVKDPSMGNIARQLFEKWVAMTYPFFINEDLNWISPAFQILASRYLKLSVLPAALSSWLAIPLHQIFLEEIQLMIEDPHQQIG